jgi:hypothetical protein
MRGEGLHEGDAKLTPHLRNATVYRPRLTSPHSDEPAGKSERPVFGRHFDEISD